MCLGAKTSVRMISLARVSIVREFPGRDIRRIPRGIPLMIWIIKIVWFGGQGSYTIGDIDLGRFCFSRDAVHSPGSGAKVASSQKRPRRHGPGMTFSEFFTMKSGVAPKRPSVASIASPSARKDASHVWRMRTRFPVVTTTSFGRKRNSQPFCAPPRASARIHPTSPPVGVAKVLDLARVVGKLHKVEFFATNRLKRREFADYRGISP